MPSLPYTPAVLRYTGGEFNPEPIRFTFEPAAMQFSGGAFDLAVALASELLDLLVKRLPRLQRNVSYFDRDGKPTQQMQQFWQSFAEGIEASFTALGANDVSQQNIIEQLQAAILIGTQAKQAVDEVSARIDLANSYTDPISVLTASSDGTITIAAHERVYDNGARVSVNAGSLTGYAPGAFVRVYYEDAARAGGAVAYQGALTDVAQQGNTHVVGGATIPQVGETPSDGTGVMPPGYVFDPRSIEIPIF